MDFSALEPQDFFPRPYLGCGYRLVESQEEAATLSLVDDFDEQMLLESLLDEVKPPYRSGTEHLHYLLKTPFRYPPLRHGSRFGSITMESFFYASESWQTCLAEVAYYRFVFMADMLAPYLEPLRSEHMLYSVDINARDCADLTLLQGREVQQQLTHKSNYAYTQAMGAWLLQQQAQMIRYTSARAEVGVNLALHDPLVLQSTEPQECEYWICQSSADKVAFSRRNSRSMPLTWFLKDFLQDGQLPRPA
ncbi:RES family NAD+ phosphorylase [Shewanella algae]|uniref:RES family NAD+ phosphorylase n=1 Tax=Shewanella algae TaxID=38313 RepID=UPI001C045F0F|nr:RES family NAD+ phosphorylase [Shewanella algae]QWL08998.1 RES family NAD+ phosphorylase [Shewanella algae]